MVEYGFDVRVNLDEVVVVAKPKDDVENIAESWKK